MHLLPALHTIARPYHRKPKYEQYLFKVVKNQNQHNKECMIISSHNKILCFPVHTHIAHSCGMFVVVCSCFNFNFHLTTEFYNWEFSSLQTIKWHTADAFVVYILSHTLSVCASVCVWGWENVLECGTLHILAQTHRHRVMDKWKKWKNKRIYQPTS